jgi:hypothetical protein
MKVIFLDIDGVLNTGGADALYPWVYELNHKNWHKSAVKRLDWLCKKTDAVVVISSTWRKLGMNSVDWWNSEFYQAGARNINVIGCTGNAYNGFRGREVRHWLANDSDQEVTHYVCIDDDSDFYPYQPRVRTKAFCGLTQGNVWEAYAILMGASKGTGKRCMEERNVL